MRCVLHSVVALAACAAAALGQPGGVGVIVVEDGGAVSAPECGSGATYAVLNASTPWELGTPGAAEPTAYFAPTDSETVASDLPVDINGRTGTVDWILARGVLIQAGEPALNVGVLVADVTLDDVGAGVTTFRIVSVIEDDVAMEAIAAARESGGVVIVPEGDGGGTLALGSSCSCPACPLGGRFWVPFFVIGVGNVPGGQACCATACAVACGALHEGQSMEQAWLAGQGTWVSCMLCQ